MAQFKTGDLREEALARVIVDWETGDHLGDETHPLYVQGTMTLDDEWTVTSSVGTESGNERWWDVPNAFEWQLLWLKVAFTSDANVGNRQLVLEVQRAGAPISAELARAGQVQAASLVRYYLMAPGVADMLAFRDTDYLTTPVPVTSILRAGDRLRVFDNNGVSAADQIEYWLQYAWRTV